MMTLPSQFRFGHVLCNVFFGLCLLFGSTCDGAELVLGEQGKSDYQIVLPDQYPSPSVGDSLQQTARLMQTAFQASGLELVVVLESKRDQSKPAIFLGDTSFARAQKIEAAKLSGWNYVHKVVGRDVVIAGRDQPAPGNRPPQPFLTVTVG